MLYRQFLDFVPNLLIPKKISISKLIEYVL